MKQNTFRQVFDRANRRVRGLWIRNSSDYVRSTITDPATWLKKTTKLRLEKASKLDEATTKAVTLKKKSTGAKAVFSVNDGKYSVKAVV
jgi:hypothetical protein